MANLTAQNPIRYNIDVLDTASTGIIITKAGSEIDCSNATKVTGFKFQYSQPSGTTIRFLFRTSDSAKWFKLNTSGNISNVTSNTPDYDITAKKGNSISELSALTNIPAFIGKKILIAVALGTPDKTNAIPKVKLSIKTQTSSQQLSTSTTSALYDLGGEGQISEIQYTPSITGNGTLKLYAQLTYENGEVSDWLDITAASGVKCRSVKLKVVYTVNRIDSDSVKLDEAIIVYTDGTSIVSGAGSGEIVSLTQDWYMNVKNCRLSVRHSPLVNSKLEAYVSMRKRPLLVQGEHLVIGTGKSSTYQLSHSDGIKYDTVKLYYDNARVYSGFEVNCEVGRVTCNAPSGVIVSCDYEADWTEEVWGKMSRVYTDSLEDYDVSEFRLTSEVKDASVCAVKLVLTTTTGSVTNENIGKGTGKIRTYKLNHIVKDGNITVYSNGIALSKKSYTLLDDPQYIRIAGTKNQTLTASYTWISETPCVYQFAAVFSE